MKIGLVMDELAPGSAPKLVGWPIRELKKIGVEGEAIVIIEKEYWKENKELYDQHLNGIKVRYLFDYYPKFLQKLNFKFPGMSFFSFHHILARFFAHRAIKKSEFDILIAYCNYTTLATNSILSKHKTPYLSLLWDPATYTAKKIYREKFGWKYPILYTMAKVLDFYSLRKCKAVITSGRFHHKEFTRCSDGKPLEILYPGCFSLDNLPDFDSREKMMINYDRWDPGNTPNIFLDVLAGVEDKSVTLTIGGFWYSDEIKQSFLNDVKERNLEDRVTVLGPLDEKMILELCSKAMIHVHPIHEAFGMPTLEAAACGCIPIIPTGSGSSELFVDGESAFTPAIGDIDAIVQACNKIFANPALAKKMSEKAWHVAREYSWAGYASKLKKILEKYLPGGLKKKGNLH